MKQTNETVAYAVNDFREFREKGYYYVDKTKYIENIEATNWPILLRPRRFGKSLFTSMLFYYYDINSKHLFNTLFKDTHIGNNPTSGVNNYYILQFDFSDMKPTKDLVSLELSFNNVVKDSIEVFIDHYQLNIDLEPRDSASSYISQFLSKVSGNIPDNKKVYIIIDEYDHFTNDLLTDKNKFLEIVTVHGEETDENNTGFVRAFYAALKKGTKNIIGQIFITGVSPITVDSMTSGYNIGTNLSLRPSVNEIMGFTKEETRQLIKQSGIDNVEETLELFERYYNGYIFNDGIEGERVFNSTMVLYYLDYYQKEKRIPQQMLDANVLSDYSKIAANFDLYESDEDKEEMLISLMQTNKVEVSAISSVFNLDIGINKADVTSLLYYFGLLTIDNYITKYDVYELRIPNKVIRDVYFEYFNKYLSDLAIVNTDSEHIKVAFRKLVRDNKEA